MTDGLLMPPACVEILDKRAAPVRIIAYATSFVVIGAWCFFIPFVLLDWHDLGADVTILLCLFGLVVAGLPAIGVLKGIGGQAREIANVTAELSGRGVCIPGELMIDTSRIRKIRISRWEKGCAKVVLHLHGGAQVRLSPMTRGIDENREADEYCRLCELFRSRLSVGRSARGTGGGT